MFKKTFLIATTLILSATLFGLLQTKGLTHKDVTPTDVASKQVLGLSDSPLYIPSDYKNLGSPFSVLPLSDGSVWFYDVMKYRLVKVSPEGQIVRTIGRYGTNVGELAGQVDSMAADNNGNIYFAGRCLAYKLDSNGGEVKRWNICDGRTDGYAGSMSPRIAYNSVTNRIYILRNHGVNPVSNTAETPDLGSISEYTTDGVYVSEMAMHLPLRDMPNMGEMLYRPMYIRTGTDGKIYVYEHLEDHSPGGAGPWPTTIMIVQVYSSDKTFISEFDATSGNFFHYDMAVLSSGKVATVINSVPNVHVFNSSGNLESSWGEYGTNAWQFLSPRLAAGDSEGNIWINDDGLNSLQKFSSSGVFLSAIRNNGTVDSRLTRPTGIGFDTSGNAYVLDNGEIDPRVQKFSSNGTFLATIVPFSSTALSTHAYYLKVFNDKVYVSDKDKVTVFDLSGNVLDVIGSTGTGDGQFRAAQGMSMDSTGNLYVADAGNHRIQKFDTNGDYISQWGTSGTADNQFMYPTAVYVDSSNNVFVAESGNSVNGLTQPYDNYDNNGDSEQPITRIKVFDSAGTYLRKFNAGTSTEPIMDMTLNHSGQLEYTLYGFSSSVFIYELDGTPVSSYGTYGSGVEEFSGASGIAMNPLTNFMTIADTYNHRIQLLPSGTRIYNLISSADVVQNNSTASLVREYYNPAAPGVNSISSSMYFGDYIVSDFSVNLTQKRDWESVSVVTLPEESKSLVANLNPSGAPGISATHSLFVVKQAGQTGVRVCPTATQITDITASCSGGYTLRVGDSKLSTVTIGDVEYWKVTGLTGTGVMALNTTVTPTPTVTTSGTPTPTVTATPRVTTTVKATPVSTPLVRIPVVTLTAAVIGVTSPSCPIFDSFTTSATIIKKGEKVKFTWQTRNTETVTNKYIATSLSPVDTLSIALSETEELTFVADNGFCNAKKTVTIHVVETLPWTNTTAVGTGLLLVEAAIALQQPMLFGNLWLGLLSLLDKRKKRSWGFVYDSNTKKPISRAVIRLITFDGRTVDTVVSEANGTFKLAPHVGEFTVTVSHPAYSFPSKIVVGNTDQGYSNVYLGGKVKVNNSTEGIILSIPLDAKELTEVQKNRLRLNKILQNVFTYGALTLMLAGLLYSMYVAIMFPHIFNYLVLVAYLVIVGAKILFSLQPQKTFGRVVGVSGKPMSGIELGLFDPEFNTIQYRTFSTANGEYSFLVPNARYILKVMDKRYFIMVNSTKAQEMILPKASGIMAARVINQKIVLVE